LGELLALPKQGICTLFSVIGIGSSEYELKEDGGRERDIWLLGTGHT
jgi:hypothetical protein